MQEGHHAKLKAEVGGCIGKAKSTRDGQQTPGSERQGVDGIRPHRLQEEPKPRAPRFQSLPSRPETANSVVYVAHVVVHCDSSPSKCYTSPAWGNQSCPLNGTGAGFQGWGRMGPELLSCPGSQPVMTVAVPNPLLLAVSTVRGTEMPHAGPALGAPNLGSCTGPHALKSPLLVSGVAILKFLVVFEQRPDVVTLYWSLHTV